MSIHYDLRDPWVTGISYLSLLCKQRDPLAPSGICGMMCGKDFTFEHPAQHWQAGCQEELFVSASHFWHKSNPSISCQDFFFSCGLTGLTSFLSPAPRTPILLGLVSSPFLRAASGGCIHNPAEFDTFRAVFSEDQKAQERWERAGCARATSLRKRWKQNGAVTKWCSSRSVLTFSSSWNCVPQRWCAGYRKTAWPHPCSAHSLQPEHTLCHLHLTKEG